MQIPNNNAQTDIRKVLHSNNPTVASPRSSGALGPVGHAEFVNACSTSGTAIYQAVSRGKKKKKKKKEGEEEEEEGRRRRRGKKKKKRKKKTHKIENKKRRRRVIRRRKMTRKKEREEVRAGGAGLGRDCFIFIRVRHFLEVLGISRLVIDRPRRRCQVSPATQRNCELACATRGVRAAQRSPL
jgi:hypothetical protein